jgi:transcriptional regulator with XRE-family HTH domain
MERKKKGRPTHIDKAVGQKVKEIRVGLKISQEKLADELGVTFQQVQKYENGVNRISAGSLYLISKFFKKPLNAFYSEVGNG